MNSRFTRATRRKLGSRKRKLASRKHRVVSLESLEKRQLLTAELLPNPLLEGETSFVAYPLQAASPQAADPLVPLGESLRSVESTAGLEHGDLTADAERLAQRALMGEAPSVDVLADSMTQQLQRRLPSNELLRSQLLVTPVQPEGRQPETGQLAFSSADGVEPNTEFSVLVDGQIASRLLPAGNLSSGKLPAEKSVTTQYTAMSAAVVDSDAVDQQPLRSRNHNLHRIARLDQPGRGWHGLGADLHGK